MSTTPVSAHVIGYAAFTNHPGGGNPAGIVLDAISLDEERMLGVARESGVLRTSVSSAAPQAAREYDVRYFSPEAEVPFCGHATVAACVALTGRDGPGEFVFPISTGRHRFQRDATRRVSQPHL